MEIKVKSVIYQRDLRPVCGRILDEEIRPIHYADLTRMAINRVGRNGVDFTKVKEDVREKILMAGLDGCGYIGAPYCYAFKKKWIKGDQAVLNFEEPIPVPVTVSSSTAGACETIYRFKHMIHKPTGTYIPIDEAEPGVVKFRIERAIVEQNVSDYFKQNWPKLWMPPSNDKKYKKPASDDFRIRVKNYIYNFDVFTPGRNGKGGLVKWKRPAHIHVMAEYDDDGVNIRGFTTGQLFSSHQWSPEEIYPFHQLVFWLNCMQDDMPYDKIRDAALF